jgi:hypothetical protein
MLPELGGVASHFRSRNHHIIAGRCRYFSRFSSIRLVCGGRIMDSCGGMSPRTRDITLNPGPPGIARTEFRRRPSKRGPLVTRGQIRPRPGLKPAQERRIAASYSLKKSEPRNLPLKAFRVLPIFRSFMPRRIREGTLQHFHLGQYSQSTIFESPMLSFQASIRMWTQ